MYSDRLPPKIPVKPSGKRRGLPPVLILAIAVLLQLIYLLVGAAAVFGIVYSGLTLATTGFSGGAWIYTVVVAVCLALIWLLLYPLLPSSSRKDSSYLLDELSHPHIYDFARKLAAALGSPEITGIRVDSTVDASAHIPLWTGKKKEFELIIGMPLIGCCDLAQFTSILAHQLGYYREGASSKAEQLIHSINRTLYDKAYGRDRAVIDLSEYLRSSGLNGSGARLLTRINSAAFKLLTKCTLIATENLSKQEIHDSDLVSASLVGSKTAGEALLALQKIDHAVEYSRIDLSKALYDGVLPDNFIGLIQLHFARSADKSTYDPEKQPFLNSRLEALKEAALPPLFTDKVPAHNLFLSFEDLSNIVTNRFYEHVLEDHYDPDILRSHQDIFALCQRAEQQFTAIDQIFRGRINDYRFISKDANKAITEDSDLAHSKSVLSQKRLGLERTEQQYKKLLQEFIKADDDLDTSQLMVELVKGVAEDQDQIGEFRTQVAANQKRKTELDAKLSGLEVDAAEYVAALLQLVRLDGLPECDISMDELAQYLRSLKHLQDIEKDYFLIAQHGHRLELLRNPQQIGLGPQAVQASLMREMKTATANFQRLSTSLTKIANPFAQSDNVENLGALLVPVVPNEADPIDIFNAINHFVNGYLELYNRVYSVLGYLGAELEKKCKAS